ncbi:MAG: amidohydrolase family protein, partial [Gemmatimonadaceae bacterium]
AQPRADMPIPSRSRPLALLLTLSLPVAAAAQGGPAEPGPLRELPARGTVAFVGVAVASAEADRALPGQTVVVRDGRIVAVGPEARTAVPPGAVRIDGRGRFLAPGLVDTHAHWAAGDESLATGAGRQLALYLANGVTTVRGLGGASTALRLRDRVRAGDVLGPAMYVAAPSLNGNSVKSPAEAVQKVAAAKAAGYDAIKTHGNFSSGEVYDSMAAATHRAGLPLSGHVTPEFGLRRAIEAGQQVEHLDGFIAAATRDGAPPPGGAEGGQLVFDPVALANVDSAKVKALAAEMARRKIVNGPTLALFELLASDETPEQLAAREEMRYAPARAVAQWKTQVGEITRSAPAEGRHAFIALRRGIVRELYAAGVQLLPGSDSPQLFMLPGFGLHRELRALADAGLPPRAVLAAATRDAAAYLGRSDAGRVAVGARADLVLLDADPFADVSNLQRIAGVMVDGRWLPKERLDAMREAVAREVAKIQ